MNNQKLQNNIFSTNDLALATSLSLYIPLLDIDKTNPKRALFIFQKSKQLDQLINQYWQGALQVNPMTFFGQLKVIKTRLYQ